MLKSPSQNILKASYPFALVAVFPTPQECKGKPSLGKPLQSQAINTLVLSHGTKKFDMLFVESLQYTYSYTFSCHYADIDNK